MQALALDFDGTLVSPFTPRPLTVALHAVDRIDSDLPVAICTNQSGPVYRLSGTYGRHSYPSPSEVGENLDVGLRAVGLPPQRVAALLIATWPGEAWPGDRARAAQLAQMAATALMQLLHARGWSQAYATAAPTWRKPGPGMLFGVADRLGVALSAIRYVGDRHEDAIAAQTAGCQFQTAKDWWKGKP